MKLIANKVFFAFALMILQINCMDLSTNPGGPQPLPHPVKKTVSFAVPASRESSTSTSSSTNGSEASDSPRNSGETVIGSQPSNSPNESGETILLGKEATSEDIDRAMKSGKGIVLDAQALATYRQRLQEEIPLSPTSQSSVESERIPFQDTLNKWKEADSPRRDSTSLRLSGSPRSASSPALLNSTLSPRASKPAAVSVQEVQPPTLKEVKPASESPVSPELAIVSAQAEAPDVSPTTSEPCSDSELESKLAQAQITAKNLREGDGRNLSRPSALVLAGSPPPTPDLLIKEPVSPRGGPEGVIPITPSCEDEVIEVFDKPAARPTLVSPVPLPGSSMAIIDGSGAFSDEYQKRSASPAPAGPPSTPLDLSTRNVSSIENILARLENPGTALITAAELEQVNQYIKENEWSSLTGGAKMSIYQHNYLHHLPAARQELEDHSALALALEEEKERKAIIPRTPGQESVSNPDNKSTSKLVYAAEAVALLTALWVGTEAILAYKNIPQKEWDKQKSWIKKAELIAKKTGSALWHRPGKISQQLRDLVTTKKENPIHKQWW